MPSRPTPPKGSGIHPKNTGYRVKVIIDKLAHYHSCTAEEAFRTKPPFLILLNWKTQQLAIHDGGDAAPPTGSLAGDITEYADSGADARRVTYLWKWADELGADRPTLGIAAIELNDVMHRWSTTPTNQERRFRQGRPSAATGLDDQSLKKRRDHLAVFVDWVIARDVRREHPTAAPGELAAFTATAQATRNPVRFSQKYKNPAPSTLEARGTDELHILDRILDAMPAVRSHKPGAIPVPSAARIMAAVELWTGMAPATIQRLDRTDFDPIAATIRLPERMKGEGVPRATEPLSSRGVTALGAFDAAGLWHQIDASVINTTYKAVKKAVAKVRAQIAAEDVTRAAAGEPADSPTRQALRTTLAKLQTCGTQKDLRHSFASALYAREVDLSAIGRLMQHAPGSPLTARYAKAAHATIDRRAVALLDAPATPAPKPSGENREKKVPTKVPNVAKPRLILRLAAK
ncbi:MAG TPA: hypothetical protein VK595_09550 [Vicinamibacterales bacterium]|nr:hypothetical protein [Vicinamibacterales bacterium]